MTIILIDVQMPIMDGFTATRAIREMERAHRVGHTLIVAMTAHASKDDEHRCPDAGMDAFISKPINLQANVVLINDLIKQKSCGGQLTGKCSRGLSCCNVDKKISSHDFSLFNQCDSNPFG